MMRKIVCLCVALCFAVGLFAQKDSSLKYQVFVDVESGIAYNLNTAQTMSANNMQYFTTVTAIHGIQMKQYFAGLGVGYMHSYRDKENIYPMYGVFRYTWETLA